MKGCLASEINLNNEKKKAFSTASLGNQVKMMMI